MGSQALYAIVCRFANLISVIAKGKGTRKTLIGTGGVGFVEPVQDQGNGTTR
jgi:hypothetical protein